MPTETFPDESMSPSAVEVHGAPYKSARDSVSGACLKKAPVLGLVPVLWVDWREKGRQGETSAKPFTLNTYVSSHTFIPTQTHFSCCRHLAVHSFFVWLAEPTSDVGNVLSLELATHGQVAPAVDR